MATCKTSTATSAMGRGRVTRTPSPQERRATKAPTGRPEMTTHQLAAIRAQLTAQLTAVPLPATMREVPEWTAWVRDLARTCGWLEYHTYRSTHSPAGFPDLCLVRGARLIFAELKTNTGKLSPFQEEWLARLRGVPGVEVCVWRPRDVDAVVRVLTHEERAA